MPFRSAPIVSKSTTVELGANTKSTPETREHFDKLGLIAGAFLKANLGPRELQQGVRILRRRVMTPTRRNPSYRMRFYVGA